MSKNIGENHFKAVKDLAFAGQIICYIAVCFPAINLLFLFISWLGQINGVYKNITFNMFFILT